MPIGISDETRNQVIREWLAGEPRDKIASDTELAASTVTNMFAIGGKSQVITQQMPYGNLQQIKKDWALVQLTALQVLEQSTQSKNLVQQKQIKRKAQNHLSQISITNVILWLNTG